MNTEQAGRNDLRRPDGRENLPRWLELVRRHVDTLKFGTVQITVHDSRVTQVERSEKTRIDPHE